jgi:hypothetical protein
MIYRADTPPFKKTLPFIQNLWYTKYLKPAVQALARRKAPEGRNRQFFAENARTVGMMPAPLTRIFPLLFCLLTKISGKGATGT